MGEDWAAETARSLRLREGSRRVRGPGAEAGGRRVEIGDGLPFRRSFKLGVYGHLERGRTERKELGTDVWFGGHGF